MPKPVAKRLVIEDHLVKRYCETFPHYAYSGAEAAIDLMAAEITTLRKELARIVSESCPLPDAEPNERTDDEAD